MEVGVGGPGGTSFGQIILTGGGKQIMPATLLRALSDFQAFLRHCKLYRIHSGQKSSLHHLVYFVEKCQYQPNFFARKLCNKITAKKLIPSTIFLDAKAISGH